MPIVIIAVILLIFPFFVSIYFSVQKTEKTLRFAITVFGITVFRFNAALFGSGIFVNRTFKKPYKLEFTPVFDGKMIKFPKLKGVSVLSVRGVSRVGFEDDFFITLYMSALFFAENAIFRAFNIKKPHLQIKNDLNLYQDKNIFDVFLRLNVVFNSVDIIYILINFLSEKIRYAIGRK